MRSRVIEAAAAAVERVPIEPGAELKEEHVGGMEKIGPAGEEKKRLTATQG